MCSGDKLHNFTCGLTLFLLVVFCTPYTCFDEANAYLTDTESELVHYYLTPLPDNGEACIAPPVFRPFIISCAVPEREFLNSAVAPLFAFFHPPK